MVQAGVDHQPHGAEQIGLQIADPAQRIAGIDIQIIRGDPLGIQGPTLVEGGVAGDAAIKRQAAGLACDGDLEMVAG